MIEGARPPPASACRLGGIACHSSGGRGSAAGPAAGVPQGGGGGGGGAAGAGPRVCAPRATAGGGPCAPSRCCCQGITRIGARIRGLHGGPSRCLAQLDDTLRRPSLRPSLLRQLRSSHGSRLRDSARSSRASARRRYLHLPSSLRLAQVGMGRQTTQQISSGAQRALNMQRSI